MRTWGGAVEWCRIVITASVPFASAMRRWVEVRTVLTDELNRRSCTCRA